MTLVGLILLVFLAVILHKLPEGFTMASIALSAGWSRAADTGSTVSI